MDCWEKQALLLVPAAWAQASGGFTLPKNDIFSLRACWGTIPPSNRAQGTHVALWVDKSAPKGSQVTYVAVSIWYLRSQPLLNGPPRHLCGEHPSLPWLGWLACCALPWLGLAWACLACLASNNNSGGGAAAAGRRRRPVVVAGKASNTCPGQTKPRQGTTSKPT